MEVHLYDLPSDSNFPHVYHDKFKVSSRTVGDLPRAWDR